MSFWQKNSHGAVVTHISDLPQQITNFMTSRAESLYGGDSRLCYSIYRQGERFPIFSLPAFSSLWATCNLLHREICIYWPGVTQQPVSLLNCATYAAVRNTHTLSPSRSGHPIPTAAVGNKVTFGHLQERKKKNTEIMGHCWGVCRGECKMAAHSNWLQRQ